MTTLAGWCFQHRKRVVALWLLALVVTVALSQQLGSNFNSNFTLPGTDSHAAVTLLIQDFPAASGEGDQIVFRATGGTTLTSCAERAAVTAALQKVSRVPGVAAIGSPFSTAGAAQISRDRTVAFATVTWNKVADKVTDSDAKRLVDAATTARSSTLQVSLNGESISSEESAGPGLSIGVGVIAAFVILLIVFGGALFASAMPLLTAVLALVMATSLIDLMTHAFDVASVSSDLAVLIGLGVGVDYGLFIISRQRSGVKAGLSCEDAAAAAVNTSGRTVLFAGLTVCIALLGQFALGVSFLYGLSLSSALAVALTMATSLTFLPAMLGFLGPKVLSRRERARLVVGVDPEGEISRFWMRWARAIEAHRAGVALGALAVVVAIAAPILGLRLGSSDASTDPSSSTTHQAYEALSTGFGPGLTGPLELVSQVSSPSDTEAFSTLLKTVERTPGVAAVTSPIRSPNHRVLVATVYSTNSPQASQTVALVGRLRDTVIPEAEQGSTLDVHVGGVTATDIDFSRVLGQKLPLFIAVVVLLAFVLLMMVFRSLLIPLVASVMNLISVGAALGALNAVFNWGWGHSLIGLSGTGPVDAFIPVLLFSVLFGLSMDYEVYLVSRIQEEWHTGGGNARAVVIGQAKSGRIIAAAAVIMVLVFGSFLLNGSRLLQEFGFGLGFAVLTDALIIRSLLVPALMHLIGERNWSLPAKLGHLVPNIAIEQQAAPVG